MFALRRSASRLLTTRHASFLSSRTYTSFSAPSIRLSHQRTSALESQRRWATTGSEKLPPAPAAAETANATEATEETLPAAETNEHLRAQSQDATIADPPAAAEPANATEATDEELPAAEINERFTATAERTSSRAAPGAAEPANLTEATDEEFPAAETNERYSSNSSRAPAYREEREAPEPKKTLYIGNLFFDVTETDVVKEFARFGTVTKCKIVRDSRGLSKGFAYLDFSTQEAADEALKRLNMQLFEGRRVTVQYAARPSTAIDTNNLRRGANEPRNPPSKTLFIGNMSFEMTDRDLSNLFRGIRNVIDVRVAIDRRTGQPRGFAHADFTDVKSAMDAMKSLQEKEIYGRRLRIDYSYSSSDRAPRNNQADQAPEE